MTAATLLEGLKARGATAAARGDRLKLAAPHGVLTPRVLAAIRAHKPALLEFLSYSPLMQEMLTAHPELNNPADVAALLEYFDELPFLPSFKSAYCDELREAAPIELHLS